MLTDSSLYDAEGIIFDFDRKAFPVEAWNGVVSFRGNMMGMVAIGEMAEHYASFDEFIARSAPTFEHIHRVALAAGNLSGQTLFELHAMGWSEREDRARAFILQCGLPRGLQSGRPDYVWVSLDDEEEGSCHYADLSNRALWRLHRVGAEPDEDFTAETFDPIRHGIPLAEEQRRTTVDPKFGLGGGNIHFIGGDLWVTVVERSGTSGGIIHSWPDTIGERIVPEVIDEDTLPKIVPSGAKGWTFDEFAEGLAKGIIDPETLGPKMTRHQRRAAEAKAKEEAKRARKLSRAA